MVSEIRVDDPGIGAHEARAELVGAPGTPERANKTSSETLEALHDALSDGTVAPLEVVRVWRVVNPVERDTEGIPPG